MPSPAHYQNIPVFMFTCINAIHYLRNTDNWTTYVREGWWHGYFENVGLHNDDAKCNHSM